MKTIETVMTYSEWEKLHNRRQKTDELFAKMEKKRDRQKTMYFIRQKLIGLMLVLIGIICPVLLKEGTVSLFIVPIGLCIMLTRERVITFKGWEDE